MNRIRSLNKVLLSFDLAKRGFYEEKLASDREKSEKSQCTVPYWKYLSDGKIENTR